ncbi:DUF3887 domain-containing protein [Mollicutes bacterium LVI A0039]|nr:DUF3887 domain-containing protein [Mollicutes bacterium LVI A0039]
MKKLYLVVITLVLAVVLSGCSAPELADIYVGTEVEEFGKEIVELANDKDYQAINDRARDDLKDALSAQVLEEVITPLLDNGGTFVDYKRIDVFGGVDDQTGEDFATVVLICEYENSKLSYTITVNQDYQIVGFYIK